MVAMSKSNTAEIFLPNNTYSLPAAEFLTFAAQYASLNAGTTKKDEEKIKKRPIVESKGNKLNSGCNWRQVSFAR